MNRPRKWSWLAAYPIPARRSDVTALITVIQTVNRVIVRGYRIDWPKSVTEDDRRARPRRHAGLDTVPPTGQAHIYCCDWLAGWTCWTMSFIRIIARQAH